MSGFTFRRVRRLDFPLLQRWLGEPHVARWWNHEFTPEAIEHDFGPGVDGEEPGEDYIAFADGEPLGLIQFSRFEDYPEYVEELEEVMAVPVGAVSVDYLIGDASRLGQGLGTAMLVAFVERIWTEEPAATCIVVPVNSTNVASWKMLLAAGFHLVARGEMEPDNPIDNWMHEVLRLDRPRSRQGHASSTPQ
ncbi:MAG: GNAT family N-acetyltransferase [Acidimicrobiia bacterium]